MAKFDPYAYCRTHGVGSKTPITDATTGVKVTLNGLPERFTPEVLRSHGEEHGLSVSFPAVQVDAERVAKPKGGKMQGEAASGFMVGWLAIEPTPAPPTIPPTPNNRVKDHAPVK